MVPPLWPLRVLRNNLLLGPAGLPLVLPPGKRTELPPPLQAWCSLPEQVGVHLSSAEVVMSFGESGVLLEPACAKC